MITRSFDLGITHFDLANNYGPPAGSAEETFGKVLSRDLKAYRDELVISSKAGYYMWPGPYGDFGSRKYLVASLDQSLKRMGLDYVDIFYHHRMDPETPLEETMVALDHLVRSGKAQYVGVSNYSPEKTREAISILKSLGTPSLIHQPSYSMLDRWVENGLLDVLEENGSEASPSPAGSRTIDQQIFEWRARRFTRRKRIRILERKQYHARSAQDQSFEPNRSSAESESRPIRSRLGPTRRPGDICPDWGKQGEPDRGQCGRLEQPGVLEGRTGSH